MKKGYFIAYFLSAMFMVLFTACSVEQIIDNTPTYVVSFDSRGGSAVFAQAVKSGGKVSEPLAPSRTDYTFGGWYKDSECSNAWTFSSDTVISNTMLCAKWVESVFACVVTFDSHGGTAVPAQVVRSGEKVLEPQIPTIYTGFTFAGWYKEVQCSNVWVFSNDIVSSNTILYARWLGNPNFSFVFNGVGYTITDCDSNMNGDLIIPDNIYGLSVTEIESDAFQGCVGLKSISIPNRITSLGNNIFQGLTNLTSITLPNNLISLGNNAFLGCTSLTSITIPYGVKSIGFSVFQDCSNLTSVFIPNSVTNIGSYAFYSCIKLKTIIIPNGVKVISEATFLFCLELTNIIIPDSVTNIGKHAFEFCESMFSINIPSSVKIIQEWAFGSCIQLTSICIPNGVVSIQGGVFKDCFSLSSVTIPNSVISIVQGAFYGCKNIASITLQNSIISIGNSFIGDGGAFEGCTGLSSIIIPNSVTYFGYNTFKSCTNIKSLSINSLTAPSLGTTPFSGISGCTLHLKPGSTGYNVAPWTTTSIFSSIVYDL